MTSSDKKYRSKRKDKILFILLSITLMKKKYKHPVAHEKIIFMKFFHQCVR